jgi:hypothetical protein
MPKAFDWLVDMVANMMTGNQVIGFGEPLGVSPTGVLCINSSRDIFISFFLQSANPEEPERELGSLFRILTPNSWTTLVTDWQPLNYLLMLVFNATILGNYPLQVVLDKEVLDRIFTPLIQPAEKSSQPRFAPQGKSYPALDQQSPGFRTPSTGSIASPQLNLVSLPGVIPQSIHGRHHYYY